MSHGRTFKPLGEVCHIIGGGTPSKAVPSYYGGSIPWATVRDMRHDIIRATELSITRKAVQSSATNIIPAGNVVIATRVGLGKVCLLEKDTAINQDLRGIVPRNNDVYRLFLFHWFKFIAPRIIAQGTGATVQGVKAPFIKSLPFPLLSLAEQKRIVTVLGKVFDSIREARASAESEISLIEELKQSILQRAFSGSI